MTDSTDDRKHFTQAVAELGEQHAVVASRAIFNSQGLKVVDKGVAINLGLYDRLMQHKLSAPLEDSVVSVDASPAIRSSAASSIMDDVPFFGRLAPDPAARKLLLNVIETVPLPEAMAFQLTVARDVRPEIFMNLVRTALVAIWLAGRTPLTSRFDLGMAASAGLLHDIGMLHVDPVLLQPAAAAQPGTAAPALFASPVVDRAGRAPSPIPARSRARRSRAPGVPGRLGLSAQPDRRRHQPAGSHRDAVTGGGRDVCARTRAPEMQLSVLLRMNSHRYDPTMSMQLLGLVQPQLDVMSAAIVLLDDPITLLGEIDAILAQLPLVLEPAPALTPARREGMALVADHGVKIRRALAGVGAVPDQLAQLGEAAQDETVRTELTLLTREAGWQLRTLGREARRRWRNPGRRDLPTGVAKLARHD